VSGAQDGRSERPASGVTGGPARHLKMENDTRRLRGAAPKDARAHPGYV